jgi:hypothetical protein
VMNGTSGHIESSIQAHNKSVMSVAFGSHLLVTTSEDFEIHLYKIHAVSAKP